MKNEVEAKFLSVDKTAVRIALAAAGFQLETPEYMMRRKTFDFSCVAAGVQKWGRVRQEAGKVTMTIKEIRGAGIHDVYEVELTVDSFENAVSFFEACNIPEKSFQENMREVWRRGDIEVTIDTWPALDSFIEVEAPDEALVKQAAYDLGFNFEQAVYGSIDLVYERQLAIPASVIITLPQITFANPPVKTV